MLLQHARSRYKYHFCRLRKSHPVTKEFLGRWLEELLEIVRYGQQRGLPEARDVRTWFGALFKNGMIDAAYRTLPSVAGFISEVYGKIGRGGVDYGDVIRDMRIALEGNGLGLGDVVGGRWEVLG